MTAAPESVKSLAARGRTTHISGLGALLRRWERVLVVLAVCLPVPAFAATGLSIPLPATVERLAAALVPWAGAARLEADESLIVGADGAIVLAHNELADVQAGDQLIDTTTGNSGGDTPQGKDDGPKGGGSTPSGENDGSGSNPGYEGPVAESSGGGGSSGGGSSGSGSNDEGSAGGGSGSGNGGSGSGGSGSGSSDDDADPVQVVVDQVDSSTQPVVDAVEDTVDDTVGTVGGVVEDTGEVAGGLLPIGGP
jgi:hypothetical protein